MKRWFDAWQFTSAQILRIPESTHPNIVFFDARCIYATADLSDARSSVTSPSIGESGLLWRTALHGDTLTMPTSKKIPVQLLSFTDFDVRTRRPFFVMASPDYWESKGLGQEPGLTAVFLHEFAHTRQIGGLVSTIGPIDAAWNFPNELDDDAVQKQFQSDQKYAATYLAERDLLYRAAGADSVAEVRVLALQALAMMRARHARWFVGENDVFATLDDTFLSLEGAAQWAAYAWLAHPKGGKLTKSAAVTRMIGRRRTWSQDEGLGLFLVIDRLLPEWPSLVFREPSIGGISLLERATRKVSGRMPD